MKEDDRQQYIPVSRARVKERLFQIEGIEGKTLDGLEKVCEMLEVIWHHSARGVLETLKSLYENMDPDQIGTPTIVGKEEFLEKLLVALVDGNWEEVKDEEMQEAMEGEDVFPISLNVRFDEFETMRLYKLGQVTMQDVRKSWFGWKKEEFTVEAFDRVIQVLEFHEEEWFQDNKRKKHYPGDSACGLHLRLFKTVPKLDLETIFPNTSPKMRPMDKFKIVAPLVGGLVMVAMKFGPLLFGGGVGQTSTSVIGGVCTALGTYILKTYMSYQKTREKYQTQVSKDLYFKGQANNAAVLNMLVDLSEEQEVKEALLAYTFLLVEQDRGYDQESLDTRIEDWLKKEFEHDVDFEVDDAIGKLEDMKLLQTDGGGLSVKPIDEALAILDEYWDNLYDY